MSQWDTYIQYSEYARSHSLVKALQDPIVVFKQPNEKSYARFRELNQLVDVALLDISTLQYTPRAVIASAMYVLLAFHFGQATLEEISTRFADNSAFLNESYPFNDLFSRYLQSSFGYDLPELLPTIRYMSGFIALPFNYSIPSIRKQDPEAEVLDSP